MKALNLLIIFSWLVIAGTSDSSLYCQDTSDVPSILITYPNSEARWFMGKTYEIHYRLANIKKPHRIRLLKDGKYLGDFACGNDMGSKDIKLAVTCGKPLLNNVKYKPGPDYQVEVALTDLSIKVRSDVFAIISYQYESSKMIEGSSLYSQLKPLPDLTISKVQFFNNDAFKAQVTVFNKGPGLSKPCMLELEVGCGSGTLKKVTANIPALKGTKPGTWPDPQSQKTVEIKSPIPFINSKAIFTIDAGNKVKEANEVNNSWMKDNCIK
jgi:hypothetical protein